MLTVDRATEIRETATSVTANKICAIVVFTKPLAKVLLKTEKILLRK